MSDPVTLQDIYNLFEASQAKFDRSTEEFNRRTEEFNRRTAEAKAEAERQVAEARAEAERQAAAFRAEANRRAAEADRRAAEADRRLAKLEQLVANTSREVSSLGDRRGLFVENLVEPGVLRLFQQRHIDIQETYRRVRSRRPEARMEIDILAVDGDVAVAIEVKSRLAQADVNSFCEKLQKVKQAFPHLASYRVYGAVAGIEIVQDVDRYAYRKGLFVIRQCGDTVEITNDDRFQPKAW